MLMAHNDSLNPEPESYDWLSPIACTTWRRQQGSTASKGSRHRAVSAASPGLIMAMHTKARGKQRVSSRATCDPSYAGYAPSLGKLELQLSWPGSPQPLTTAALLRSFHHGAALLVGQGGQWRRPASRPLARWRASGQVQSQAGPSIRARDSHPATCSAR